MNNFLPIFITKTAQNDISAITDYIAQDNKSAAICVVNSFYKTFELISKYPETGSIKNTLKDKNIRIYAINKKFIIAYRIVKDRIEILRVLTKYQNLFALLN